MSARRAVTLHGLFVGLVLAASALASCTVTPPVQTVWPCRSDDECVPGFRCGARAGDPERTCMPGCTSSDDCEAGSVCTATGTCAVQCSFGSDGSPIEACPAGLSCGRLRYPLAASPESEGLCGAAPTCTINEDCGEGLRCASYDSTTLRGLSNLPCVPEVTATGCPAGWVGSSLGCLANCDPSPTEVSCAPGMACHRGTLVPIGARTSESACYFGFYGAPCRDDAECFVGRCTDVGGGARQCTETCDAAARVSLLPREQACRALGDRAGPLGARLVFACASSDADAACVARGGVGSGCRSDGPGPDDECADGLECRGGLCTRPCFDPMGCYLADDGGNPLANGFCDFGSGLCERLLDRGALCAFDAECATGLCAPPIPTAESRCDVPRGPTRFCSRDEECLSGRCLGSPMGLRLCD